MRVLFIGGSGNISIAATRLLAERGVDLTLLNRGRREAELPDGVQSIRADIRERAATAEALRGEKFDVVVDWCAFVPEHVETDIELFSGTISHYVFISSATVYERPSPFFPTVEEAPLGNVHWQYARDKIACEERLRHEHEQNGFPATIVRPSYTYGETWIPTAIEGQDYTVVERMRRGKKIIVPGDGESLWTMTHNSDFARALVGLLGNPEAAGESFHITSDEVLTWNQITETIAAAAGLEPEIVHIPSDFIAALDPESARASSATSRTRWSSTTRRSSASCPAGKRPSPSPRGSRARWHGSKPTRPARSWTRNGAPSSTGSSRPTSKGTVPPAQADPDLVL